MLLFSFSGLAQVEAENDSIKEFPNIEADRDLFRLGQGDGIPKGEVVEEPDTGHSPTTATLLSLIPGGGQVYNEKWWKVPIIYAGLATSGYFIYDNNQQLQFWTKIIDQRLDSTQTDEYDGVYNTNQLFTIQNTYRRYRDLSIIITVAIYGLQILDANVDAHLYNFDVSNNLSINWQPQVVADPRFGMVYGAAFTLHF